jgi:hypothetical protein
VGEVRWPREAGSQEYCHAPARGIVTIPDDVQAQLSISSPDTEYTGEHDATGAGLVLAAAIGRSPVSLDFFKDLPGASIEDLSLADSIAVPGSRDCRNA